MEAMPRHNHNKVADVLCGAFLFAATAGFVLWQNTHLTVLWDLSYILENATRISLGQLPYRDFPFPYAPLTFLVQAAIIKLFGRVVLHHYLYAAVTAGLATLLTWSILLRMLDGARMPRRLTAFLLAVPLVFLGTSSIFPHPFYDSDCTFFVLFWVWMLLRLESEKFPALATFVGGGLLVVPLFIKQNTGLAFVASCAVCVALLGVRNRRAGALLFAGAGAALGFALAVLGYTVGLGDYFHWTVDFAASRRLPGFSTMLGVYRDPSLLWIEIVLALGLGVLIVPRTAKALRWVGAALMSAPFVAAVAALFLEDNASERVEALLRLWPGLLIASLILGLWQLRRGVTVGTLVPLILLGTIHGAFLSQQLWGSTYAQWPLLMILMAGILAAVTQEANGGEDAPHLLTAADVGHRTPTAGASPLIAFAVVASAALMVTGGYYALSHERLDYVDLDGETLVRSSLPELRGLGMRGGWLPNFEELVAYCKREIPRNDAILMIPGEDLFYFTTGRRPQFPVLMMDNTVNPYSAAQLAEFARQRNVRWVVVKRELQLQEQPVAFRAQLLNLLGRDFSLEESLANYDVYRKKD
jgi:hypothetical protein